MHGDSVGNSRTAIDICAVKKDHGPCINPYPPIDLRRVMITTHALNQFKDRYPGSFTFFELLSWSEESDAISHKWEVQRLVRHGDEARYFAFGPWRFVIVEKYEGKVFLVITFEKDRVPPNPRRRISRRERKRQRQQSRREAMAW